MNKYWAIVAIWAAVGVSAFAGDIAGFVAIMAVTATFFLAD